MRSARFRFTIRRFILLIAILGTLMAAGVGGTRLLRLHRVYQDLAVRHAHEEQLSRSLLSNVAEMTAQYEEARKQIRDATKEAKIAIDSALQNPETEKQLKEMAKSDPLLKEFVSGKSQEETLLEATMRPLEEFMTVASNQASHHAQLKVKYERSARYPWIGVTGDKYALEVDLWELYLNAVEKSETEAAQLGRLPLPPGLEVAEPRQITKK